MNLYFESEKILKGLSAKENLNLKSRIFNDKNLKSSPKHLFALIFSTLKYKPYIISIIKRSKIEESQVIKKSRISKEMLMLLVYDLLFSAKGRIHSGKHRIKDAFLSHKTRLQAEFVKLKLKHKVSTIEQLPSVIDEDETPVRWFRVNPIKTKPSKFFLEYPFFGELKKTDKLPVEIGHIYEDIHIPNLYGINPKEKLTSTEAYEKGAIIIQDRASCFPAHILCANGGHSSIIDACSAPGNKTTHAASYLVSGSIKEGIIYAFERDKKRSEVLKKMCEKASGKSMSELIHITNADFTTVDPKDFPNVTGLIVDPSCSGSGIFGRSIDSAGQEESKQEIDDERLNRLARFQFTIMKHALSFPGATRIVYSTCSIHPHENERVVVDLLMDPQVKSNGWTLAPREEVLPTWERRGWKEEFSALESGVNGTESTLANGCVRAVPKEDGGIGFFAACFVRDPNFIEKE